MDKVRNGYERLTNGQNNGNDINGERKDDEGVLSETKSLDGDKSAEKKVNNTSKPGLGGSQYEMGN